MRQKRFKGGKTMFYNTMLESTNTGGSSFMSIILMVVLFIGVFYLFGVRPQKKQERQAAEMRNSLMVGDEITTIGGIIGKIVSIKEETMVIETTRDHTRIRLLKSAVRSVDVRVDEARLPKTTEIFEKDAPAAEEKPTEQENN